MTRLLYDERYVRCPKCRRRTYERDEQRRCVNCGHVKRQDKVKPNERLSLVRKAVGK